MTKFYPSKAPTAGKSLRKPPASPASATGRRRPNASWSGRTKTWSVSTTKSRSWSFRWSPSGARARRPSASCFCGTSCGDWRCPCGWTLWRRYAPGISSWTRPTGRRCASGRRPSGAWTGSTPLWRHLRSRCAPRTWRATSCALSCSPGRPRPTSWSRPLPYCGPTSKTTRTTPSASRATWTSRRTGRAVWTCRLPSAGGAWTRSTPTAGRSRRSWSSGMPPPRGRLRPPGLWLRSWRTCAAGRAWNMPEPPRARSCFPPWPPPPRRCWTGTRSSGRAYGSWRSGSPPPSRIMTIQNRPGRRPRRSGTASKTSSRVTPCGSRAGKNGPSVPWSSKINSSWTKTP